MQPMHASNEIEGTPRFPVVNRCRLEPQIPNARRHGGKHANQVDSHQTNASRAVGQAASLPCCCFWIRNDRAGWQPAPRVLRRLNQGPPRSAAQIQPRNRLAPSEPVDKELNHVEPKVSRITIRPANLPLAIHATIRDGRRVFERFEINERRHFRPFFSLLAPRLDRGKMRLSLFSLPTIALRQGNGFARAVMWRVTPAALVARVLPVILAAASSIRSTHPDCAGHGADRIRVAAARGDELLQGRERLIPKPQGQVNGRDARFVSRDTISQSSNHVCLGNLLPGLKPGAGESQPRDKFGQRDLARRLLDNFERASSAPTTAVATASSVAPSTASG